MFAFSDDMNDVFTSLASGFFNEGRSRRARPVTRALPVTLSDLYNGKTIELPRTRIIPCAACERRKSKNKSTGICSACRGSGTRLMMRQMGMMMQQMSMTCDVCGGTGRLNDFANACSVCHGRRTTEVESPLTVKIERGMHHQEELIFRGDGDVDPGTGTCGDIVIVLEQVKNEQFTREGDDLYFTHSISLAESLCGFQFILTHLDGRELIVRRERGEITKPGEVKIVVGEGMPVQERPGQFGDLIIKFNVVFPERIEQSQVDILRRALPPPKSVDLNHCEDAEECYVIREDLDNLRKELEEETRDEDEGPSVGCSAQ